MPKARYGDEDVELIRIANAMDPGFSPVAKGIQALVRKADGKKEVVPASKILLYAASDEPAAAEAPVEEPKKKKGE